MTRFQRLRSTLLGAGGLLALALMIGRLSGLVRELALASRFGISAQADVAVVLLTLPDLLVNLLLSGGLSAALVPRLRILPPDQAAQLFRIACFWTMSIFGLIALVIASWPEGIFSLLAPGLSNPMPLVGPYAMTLLAVSVPLTALSGITAAYLNAGERFFIAGLGTLIFNIAIIALLSGMRDGAALFVLAAAILLGAVLRLASQLVILPRIAWYVGSGITRMDRNFLTAFLAGIAATSLTLFPPALVRIAASLLGAGNIATVNYAQKLVELPLGILITTISTIALTRLSGHYADGNMPAARRMLHDNIRLSLFLAIAIVVFGEFLAEAVVRLIFLRGSINEGDIGPIADLTRVILLGVPFIAISSLAAAALNAQLRTGEVLRATAVSIGGMALLALPGILLSSNVLLMFAVVGSQAALACLLATKAGICFYGRDGAFDRQSAKALCLGLLVSAAFVAITRQAPTGSDFIAIALGGIGFVASVGTSMALDRRRVAL